jgi:hypothetical protein
MATTKSFQVFDSKIQSMKSVLQLTDLALTKAQKFCMSRKDNDKTVAETLGGSLDSHSQLNSPNKKKDIQRTFITNCNTVNRQAIVDLYRAFSSYVKNIVRELSERDPMKVQSLLIKKEDKNMSYPDIINLGSYEAIIEDMAAKVFRAMERKQSTPDMLKDIIQITNIEFEGDLLDDALTYLELRHLIIHNDGKADSKFLELNKRNIVRVEESRKKISYNYLLSSIAIEKVYELCKSIDKQFLDRAILLPNN